jgi:ElaB/YqjD/DUF883 family membrane-anchored ribosome-binding protein
MNTNDVAEKAGKWKDRAEDTAEDLQDKASAWQKKAIKSARKAGETADTYVRDNPWAIIASVAVVGCVIGLLLGRLRD